MFENVPLMGDTALLIAVAYLLGCLGGFGLRRLIAAPEPEVGVDAVAPAPEPPHRTPPGRDEPVSGVAGITTTPAQQLAATIEAERRARAATPVQGTAAGDADGTGVQQPAGVGSLMTIQAASVAAAVSPAHYHSTFGKPAGLPAPRPAGRDNLKLIKGIGPRIEKGLNDLGVFHFDQIAAWDKKTVVWVETHFSFKGRIGRERWIAQAQQLAASSARALRSVRV